MTGKETSASPIILKDSHDIKFVLNPWDKPYQETLVNRSCDDEVFEVYAHYLKKGDTVFDVGAHIGRYSVFPSRIVGERGCVYAFEPVADNFRMLQSTVELNKCENVISINSALGNSIGKREINLFDKEFSSWSTFGFPKMQAPDGRFLVPSRKETVSVNTLDNICEEYDVRNIDFLKIDVEGFEVEVIQGAAKMMMNGRIKIICFEISEIPLNASGHTSKELFNEITRYGYSVSKFDHEQKTFTKVDIIEKYFHANLFASPGTLE